MALSGELEQVRAHAVRAISITLDFGAIKTGLDWDGIREDLPTGDFFEVRTRSGSPTRQYFSARPLGSTSNSISRQAPPRRGLPQCGDRQSETSG